MSTPYILYYTRYNEISLAVLSAIYLGRSVIQSQHYVIQSTEMVKKMFARQPELYDHVTVISFLPHILYKVGAAHSDAVAWHVHLPPERLNNISILL